MNISYKYYIQTLRAFSVLMVIFYHLNFELFSKGYLGVDIFFVISGYVISQRIYKDYLLYGKILIKDFFIRRLKRIFPVLIFIVIFVFFTFFIFGPLNLITNTFNASFFSIFGVSNIYFLLQKKDYFDTVFNDPLGHTWSLGVEEQFYLIYPILIYGLFRVLKENREKKICLIFFIISILLIFLTFYLSDDNPSLVFYFPLFRFWEFLAGCSLFFIKINNNKKNSLFSLLFFVLILTTLLTNMPIPYLYNNLIIVIFSSLLIYFYNKSALIDFIFENTNLNIYERQSGKLVMEADNFLLEMDEQIIINDGENQWIYLTDMNEVQIIKHDPKDEMMNPKNLFTIYEKGYKYKYVGAKAENN